MSETKSARERLFDALAAGVCGHALGPYLDEVEFAAIRLATPPTPDRAAVREETWNYLAEVVEGAAHDYSRQAMWDKTGRCDFYATNLREAAGRLRGMLAAVSRPAEARGEKSRGLDLLAFLRRQRALSERAFGPLERKHGVVDHIRKELVEIEAAPRDLEEWIDVVLLAFDGAWRCDKSPEEIAAMLETKLAKNETRDWPDFRTIPEGKAIEHVRAAPRPETGEVSDEQLCDLYRAHWQTRVDNAELIKAEAMLFAFVRALLAARERA